MARYPYHSPEASFVENVPGSAPYRSDIHDFTIGTTMRFRPFGCSINAMNIAAPKLVAGITRGLFAEDIAAHWQALAAYGGMVFDPAPEDAGQ